MNLLITAGGTAERIDDVRSITNHSTGRLGQVIAEHALLNGNDVTYITTAQAIKPKQHPRLTMVEIESALDLDHTLARLLKAETFDAVIHSMAVSDFTPGLSMPDNELISRLSELLAASALNTETEISQALTSAFTTVSQERNTAKKISSDAERLILFLEQNPKVIKMVKELQPQTQLVGFKLLVGVSDEDLLRVAKESLQKNQADFVLANDLEKIHGDQHQAILLHRDGDVEKANNKQEIATLILKNIEKRQTK